MSDPWGLLRKATSKRKTAQRNNYCIVKRSLTTQLPTNHEIPENSCQKPKIIDHSPLTIGACWIGGASCDVDGVAAFVVTIRRSTAVVVALGTVLSATLSRWKSDTVSETIGPTRSRNAFSLFVRWFVRGRFALSAISGFASRLRFTGTNWIHWRPLIHLV